LNLLGVQIVREGVASSHSKLRDLLLTNAVILARLG
jgi:hypothetical protein